MLVKYIHVSFVILTLIFFVIRGLWMIRDSPLVKQKWVKILAPVIDTILLGSAVIRAVEIGQYPFVNSWLTSKFLVMLLYIVLGMVALRYGKTKTIRVSAWFGALLCFGYIVSVAVSRNPAVIF